MPQDRPSPVRARPIHELAPAHAGTVYRATRKPCYQGCSLRRAFPPTRSSVLIFLLQIRDLVSNAPFEIYLFALFTAIVWIIWAMKVVLSRALPPVDRTRSTRRPLS